MNATRSVACGLLAAAVLLAATPLSADLVRLSNGGEIRGELQTESSDDSVVVIRSLAGAVITIAREDTRFIAKRSPLVEDYETRARRVENTVEAQWELAEWCRRNRLKDEREAHLEQLLQIDPDYEAARKALDHVYEDGEWLPRAEAMERKGYVRYRNKWITKEELALREKSDEQRAAERKWFTKLRLWHKWLTGRHADRRSQAIAELRDLRDPAAVSGLTRLYSDDDLVAVRRIFVDVLDRIPGTDAVAPLVRQSLFDSTKEIRSHALDSIDEDQYGAAMGLYADELRNSSNDIVRRAAKALAIVGDRRIIPNLVDALVTRHRYRVAVPDTNNIGFSSDGSFQMGGTQRVPIPPDIAIAMRTGQLPYGAVVIPPPSATKTKHVTVQVDHPNAEVLTLLRELTGENFGYDERSWRLWMRAQNHGD